MAPIPRTKSVRWMHTAATSAIQPRKTDLSSLDCLSYSTQTLIRPDSNSKTSTTWFVTACNISAHIAAKHVVAVSIPCTVATKPTAGEISLEFTTSASKASDTSKAFVPDLSRVNIAHLNWIVHAGHINWSWVIKRLFCRKSWNVHYFLLLVS